MISSGIKILILIVKSLQGSFDNSFLVSLLYIWYSICDVDDNDNNNTVTKVFSGISFAIFISFIHSFKFGKLISFFISLIHDSFL